MIFKTRDGYLSNHISINGVVEMVCDTSCECDEGYNYKSPYTSNKNEEATKCRYCYTSENINKLPIQEKMAFTNHVGFSPVTIDIVEENDCCDDEESELGERFFKAYCDECSAESKNLELVDKKYFLCEECREKYEKLNKEFNLE